jgi:hypothetical protein
MDVMSTTRSTFRFGKAWVEYWRREGGRRRLPLERAASRLAMLLNPPEYLI